MSWIRLLAACFLLASMAFRSAAGAEPSREALLIFAAASLADVLGEIGSTYTQQTQRPVKFSFAASSTLARQIEAGARAEVFFCADLEWMDYLESHHLIERATRRNVAGNRLVLVAPADSKIALEIAPGFALASALRTGRLATGDPDIVPVGRYARRALISLGAWNDVADRLVRAENVRSALAFVARGEVPLGIVYETDALIEKRVRIVAVFPAGSHPPIVYPAALTRTARQDAREFLAFLAGASAQNVFRKHGFRPPAAH